MLWAFSAQPQAEAGLDMIPPPAPPVVYGPARGARSGVHPMGGTLYSIGDPTDEEQYYLELINRARADPAGEGIRLATSPDPDVQDSLGAPPLGFGVDLGQLVEELQTNPPAPPLSFNAGLLEAARSHTWDMFTNVMQGHVSSDGRLLTNRLEQAGYDYSLAGENVFSRAASVLHGHAAFEVDWGYGVSGMQGPPRTHRENIHRADFREAGIGVLNGTRTRTGVQPVGPQLVTQDFGSRSDPVPFITGVAFYDLNTNGFYDPGEGIEGVAVEVPGSAYHAVTAGSGGYSVPVPGDGVYTVAFQAYEAEPEPLEVEVSQGNNAKLDLKLAYGGPVVSGPTELTRDDSATFALSKVSGATAYRWSYLPVAVHDAVEGAESGANHLLINISTGYEVIDARAAASGDHSFHLAMPAPADQTIELNYNLMPEPQSLLLFASRMGYAFTNQIARVQASFNQGSTWFDLWQRAGATLVPTAPAPGQSTFEAVSLPLHDYQGRRLRIRFKFEFAPGYRFTQTDASTGWHFDDVRFVGVGELGAQVTREIAAPAFTWTPPSDGDFLVFAEPRISGRWFPSGPILPVTVFAEPFVGIRIAEVTRSGTDGLTMRCQVVSVEFSTLQVERREPFQSPWEPMLLDPPELVDGAYVFEVPRDPAPHVWYRVVARP